MKKYIFIFVFTFLFPISTFALTIDQVNSIINLLTVFNVTPSVIGNVQVQLLATVPSGKENPLPIINPIVITIPEMSVQIQQYNQPVVTPPINPVVGSITPTNAPIQVKIGKITPYNRDSSTYFYFDKDVYVKTLKVKVVNVIKTDDSDFIVKQVNVNITPNGDPTKISIGGSSEIIKDGATEFSVPINHLVKSSDSIRFSYGAGINKGDVTRMDLSLDGANSEAMIDDKPVILPELTIRIVNNE